MSRRARLPLVRTLVSSGLVAGIAVVASASGAAAAPAGTALAGALQPIGSLPRHATTTDSLNWAGYAVTPGSGITAVDSAFTVPPAGALPPGFSATWAGIGGYSTSDLIQAGVAEQSTPSNPLVGPQYYAWYEILPAAETPITGCSGDTSCTVHPGDQVTVSIQEGSPGSWTINMTDAGKWSYSHTLTYASSGSSAEWIQEAPTLVALQTLPAPVGTVHFGPTSNYTVSGTTKTIAQGSPTAINEGVVSPVDVAVTSPLAADGQSFNVCVYALSCPAP